MHNQILVLLGLEFFSSSRLDLVVSKQLQIFNQVCVLNEVIFREIFVSLRLSIKYVSLSLILAKNLVVGR